jgi:hypothetical protein
MIHYYTNREISKVLEINLAKWKRWSRSFLPPDPLGGLQSGYARQYTFNDLFKVFLGGYFLQHLKMSVAESQQILDDLSPWLKKEGFLRLGGPNKNLILKNGNPVKFRIYFCPEPKHNGSSKIGFRYLIRKIVKSEIRGTSNQRTVLDTCQEKTLTSKRSGELIHSLLDDPYVSLVNLTALYTMLVNKLQG